MKSSSIPKFIFKTLIALVVICQNVDLLAQTLDIQSREGKFQVTVKSGKGETISAPLEGLWSIATGWKDDWPANWYHAAPVKREEFGEWHILSGIIKLPQGEWHLRDAY